MQQQVQRCQLPYSVSNKKTKPTTFVAKRHQTATERCNFWHSDLRDNCESAYDYVLPPHLRNANTWENVSDNLHFGDKQNSRAIKPQTQKLSTLT